MVMVAAFSHRPLWQRYTEDAAANDQRCAAQILAMLPPGGLLVFALGFFSFLWFDDCTAAQWYRYVTNVLDPQVLSARQVCELYRRRWRSGMGRA